MPSDCPVAVPGFRRFTSAEVMRLTGATPRQLQWWAEHGIVVPCLTGGCRSYDSFEVSVVRLILGLKSKGVSIQRLRPTLQSMKNELAAALCCEGRKRGDPYLLTDGETFAFEEDHSIIIGTLSGALKPMILLRVSDALKGLEANDAQ